MSASRAEGRSETRAKLSRPPALHWADKIAELGLLLRYRLAPADGGFSTRADRPLHDDV